jgi:hypothetical protein
MPSLLYQLSNRLLICIRKDLVQMQAYPLAINYFYHILAKNTPASSSGRDEFALNGYSHSKIQARSIFQ